MKSCEPTLFNSKAWFPLFSMMPYYIRRQQILFGHISCEDAEFIVSIRNFLSSRILSIKINVNVSIRSKVVAKDY